VYLLALLNFERRWRLRAADVVPVSATAHIRRQTHHVQRIGNPVHTSDPRGGAGGRRNPAGGTLALVHGFHHRSARDRVADALHRQPAVLQREVQVGNRPYSSVRWLEKFDRNDARRYPPSPEWISTPSIPLHDDSGAEFVDASLILRRPGFESRSCPA
jgi:hypothetical protein